RRTSIFPWPVVCIRIGRSTTAYSPLGVLLVRQLSFSPLRRNCRYLCPPYRQKHNRPVERPHHGSWQGRKLIEARLTVRAALARHLLLESISVSISPDRRAAREHSARLPDIALFLPL